MAGKIQGSVIAVTDAGDLVTDISSEMLSGVARTSDVRIIVDDEHETFGIFESDHQQPAMTLIAILEGAAPLKLHLVADSASLMLGVRAGANVQVCW